MSSDSHSSVFPLTNLPDESFFLVRTVLAWSGVFEGSRIRHHRNDEQVLASNDSYLTGWITSLALLKCFSLGISGRLKLINETNETVAVAATSDDVIFRLGGGDMMKYLKRRIVLYCTACRVVAGQCNVTSTVSLPSHILCAMNDDGNLRNLFLSHDGLHRPVH